MNNIEIIGYLFIPLIGSAFLFYMVIDAIIRIGCNRSCKKSIRNLLFIFYSIIGLGIAILQNSLFNLIFVIVVLPFLAHFICNNKRSYLVYYVSLTLSVYLLDLLLAVIYQWMILKEAIYFQNPMYYSILYIIASKLITLIMVKEFVLLIKKKKHEEISKKQYLASFFLPIFSIVYLFTLLYFMLIIDETYLFLFILNVVLILGLNIYFSKLFEIVERNHTLKNEIALINQKEQMQYQYYKKLEEKYRDSRGVIHDIRNHVQAIEQLYQDSDNSRALAYTKDIYEMLNGLDQKYYTSNKVLNMLLNEKERIMRERKIADDIQIREVEWKEIKDIDITIIFGNLLDNAIEAATGLEEAKIILRAEMVHDFISVCLVNTIEKEPIREKGEFRSTKSGHQGLGLKNVKRCVKKYGGDLQFDYDKKTFIVKILLPLSE